MPKIARRLGLLVVVVGMAFSTAMGPAHARPKRFVIAPVPQVSQLDYTGCGAAALAMLFGQAGPPIDYMQVVDVVRSMAHGTSLLDMVRGAHFSEKSAAVSEAYPACQPAHGYGPRRLGYGAFFHAAREPWLDGLKDVIAQGIPVAVLTDWKPGETGPHYRVITGYDDDKGLLYLNDPWPYGTSLDRYRAAEGGGWAWPYTDFLAVWALSTADWGLPGGYRYGAVIATPWKVEVRAPATVQAGEALAVQVQATYTCPPPFGRGLFPAFPARDVRLEVAVPPGFTAMGPPVQVGGKGALRAGDATPPVTFRLRAPRAPGRAVITVTARGQVEGHVPDWGATYWRKAYDYRDVIGGQCAIAVTVNPSPSK